MHHRRKKHSHAPTGFTLMEVLLVLVILVILGSLSVGLFTGISDQAKIDAARTEVGSLKRMVQLYRQTNNQYPSSLEDLINKPSDLKKPERWTKLLDANSLPKDEWDNDFQFAQPGTHNADTFDIWSSGPDGVSGNEDDIGNWEN